MDSHLYFAHFPSLGLVKIGRSSNPDRRLSSGGAFCPDPDAYIMAICLNAGGMERNVHRAFARCHWHKEMFKADSELMEWIRGGCDFSKLPKQCDDIRMDVDVSHKHDIGHIRNLAERLGIVA